MTLQEAFDETDKHMKPEDIEWFKTSGVDAIDLHHTLGQQVRNHFKLWHDGPLRATLLDLAPGQDPRDADGLSTEYVTRYLAYLRGDKAKAFGPGWSVYSLLG